MSKNFLFLALLMLASFTASAQEKRTTQATLYRQFKPSVITLTNGKTIHKQFTNVFLKNSSLVYLQGDYTMEAAMENIAAVQFDDRKYITIDNQLAYLVDSVGRNAVYRVDLFDMEAYQAQLRNNVNISNLSLSEMINVTTVDLNNEDDYKFPVFAHYYLYYDGEFIKAHEREVSRRLPKDKDIRRKYKTTIGLDTFTWNNDASLVTLLKAITPTPEQ